MAAEAGRARASVIAIELGDEQLSRLPAGLERNDPRARAAARASSPSRPHLPGGAEAQIGDWLNQGPVVMSGMVGSRQGGVEDAVCALPGRLRPRSPAPRVRWAMGVIGPGCRAATQLLVHDVMRGEEVQVLGAGQDGLHSAAGDAQQVGRG